MDPRPFARSLLPPLATLAAGFVVVGLLVVARWLHLRTDAEEAAWVEAVATVESDVAISHLWLEEHVSGDRVDVSEIDRRLERAERLVAALLGRASAPASDRPQPLRDGDALLRREAEQLAEGLRRFREISEDRRLGLERGLAVGIGSSFDVAYDETFARLLGHVQRLQAQLDIRRLDGRRREAKAFAWLAGAFTLATLLVSTWLWRRELGRLAAEAALDESRRQMTRVQRTEAVGKLAGGLAHDLDNYLASIRAQCELAMRKPHKAEQKLETALGLVDRASALIERLLAFHRGARAERPAPLELADLLRELEPMLASALGEQIELDLELPASGEWWVLAEQSSLEQVVINLAVNARDAMTSGGRLSVRLGPSPRDAGALRLRVSDTGVGIETDALERIFEPFWSSKTGGHSGLGLSIVESIVHRLAGRISVESEPGIGTTFLVDLPRTGPPSSCVHGDSASVAWPAAAEARESASTGRATRSAR